MTITNMLFEPKAGSGANTGQVSQTGSSEASRKSFDHFLEKDAATGRNEKVQRQDEPRKNEVSARKADNGKRSDRKVAAATEKTNASEAPADKNIAVENVEPKEAPVVDAQEGALSEAMGDTAESAAAKLLKKLAALLDMTEESVMQLLSQLNMQLADLVDRAGLNTFLQAVYNVENPVELLNVPGMSAIVEEVAQAVTEFAEATVLQEGAQEQAPVQSDASAQAETKTAEAEESTRKTGQDAAYVPAAAKSAAETPAPTKETPVIAEAESTPTANNAAPAVKTGSGTETESGKQFTQNQGEGTETGEDVGLKQEATGLSAAPPQETTGAQFGREIARTEAARNINTQDVVNQIVEKMKVEIKGNVSEVRITLKPEHLGDVTMKISTENGIITAQFMAESQRVKEVIEANFNQLRDMLKEQGLQIANLSVSVGQEGQDERMRQFLAEQQKAALRLNRTMRAAGAGEEALQEEPLTPDTRELLNNSVEYTA